MIAADVMTRDVITVDVQSELGQALEVLSEHDIRHLPVLEDGQRLAGILSDTDLRAFNVTRVQDLEGYERLRARLRAPVSSVMSADVITVEPETDLKEVVELMIEEKVGALPVVDTETDTLVGMVSYVDVLRAAREALAEQA
jgi:CBS-domain-containing membrane protein